MHKSKNLIVISLLSIYLFSSCEFLNFVLDDLEEEKKNSSVKTTQISIDEKDNGKEGYIVYYNKGDATGYLGRTAVSNKSEMTIYKSVFRMENGLYRDDVQFTVDDNTIRKVSSEVGAKNNIYRDLKDDKFYVATKSNANTMESLELKKFILKETGQHCRIWYLNNSSIIDDSIVTDEELQKLADTVDRIFKEETSIFGSNYIKDKPYMITADENTQIDVLVYDKSCLVLLVELLNNVKANLCSLERKNINIVNREDYVSALNSCNNWVSERATAVNENILEIVSCNVDN